MIIKIYKSLRTSEHSSITLQMHPPIDKPHVWHGAIEAAVDGESATANKSKLLTLVDTHDSPESNSSNESPPFDKLMSEEGVVGVVDGLHAVETELSLRLTEDSSELRVPFRSSRDRRVSVSSCEKRQVDPCEQ